MATPYAYDSATNNGWRQVYASTIVPHYRDGWPGVWDALKSAVTRRPRYSCAKNVTFSVWVKGEQELKATLYGAQLTTGEIT